MSSPRAQACGACERLDPAAERRRRLLSQIGAAILVRREGRVLLANRICRQALGLARTGEELTGRSILDLLHPDCRERAAQRVAALLSGELDEEFGVYRVRRPDGSEFDIEVRACSIEWDGHAAVQLVAHDLTAHTSEEQRLRTAEFARRETRKMEAVGRLANGIAHDLNNVVTAIGGFSALLLAEIPPDDSRTEYVLEIERAVQRAAALTRQVLTIGRRMPREPRELDLNRVIAELRPVLEQVIGKDVQLRVALEAGACVVHADPAQLEHVVMNLALNARDAMPAGGQLTIETRVVELNAQDAASHDDLPAGRYVQLVVSDTGTGIPADIREHIFEPFFTTRTHAAGLGLATTYSVVRQCRGSIWVQSEPGRGTSFEIFLPLRHAERAAPIPPAAPPAPAAPARPERGRTVLLVEDDASVRGLTERILQRAGYRVLPAPDGPSALAIAQSAEQRFDVVLSDVVMPHMHGPVLLTHLRRLRPGMPAVLMSGYAEESIARQCEPASATLIEKPFSSADLLAALERALPA